MSGQKKVYYCKKCGNWIIKAPLDDTGIEGVKCACGEENNFEIKTE